MQKTCFQLSLNKNITSNQRFVFFQNGSEKKEQAGSNPEDVSSLLKGLVTNGYLPEITANNITAQLEKGTLNSIETKAQLKDMNTLYDLFPTLLKAGEISGAAVNKIQNKLQKNFQESTNYKDMLLTVIETNILARKLVKDGIIKQEEADRIQKETRETPGMAEFENDRLVDLKRDANANKSDEQKQKDIDDASAEDILSNL